MSITINTRGNMHGIAGLLDSELIGEPGRERLFIEQNTGAEKCNERLKFLKAQEMKLAPAGKSDVSEDEDDFEIRFSEQEEGSVVSSRSFKQKEDSSRESSSTEISHARSTNKQKKKAQDVSTDDEVSSNRSSVKRMPVRSNAMNVYQQAKPQESGREGSEFSAKLHNNNNPVAIEYIRTDLIDDISELKQELEDEGVNIEALADLLDQIGQADVETLRLIKGILTRKTRKMQSNSIVEDLLFMLLKGVESVLDGKTEVLGVKPNLKGLTKSVSLKMRNQREYFSEILDENLARWGVGQNSKLIAEILISSVKRAVINKDIEETDDYSQSLKDLQEMYHNK